MSITLFDLDLCRSEVKEATAFGRGSWKIGNVCTLQETVPCGTTLGCALPYARNSRKAVTAGVDAAGLRQGIAGQQRQRISRRKIADKLNRFGVTTAPSQLDN